MLVVAIFKAEVKIGFTLVLDALIFDTVDTLEAELVFVVVFIVVTLELVLDVLEDETPGFLAIVLVFEVVEVSLVVIAVALIVNGFVEVITAVVLRVVVLLKVLGVVKITELVTELGLNEEVELVTPFVVVDTIGTVVKPFVDVVLIVVSLLDVVVNCVVSGEPRLEEFCPTESIDCNVTEVVCTGLDQTVLELEDICAANTLDAI